MLFFVKLRALELHFLAKGVGALIFFDAKIFRPLVIYNPAGRTKKNRIAHFELPDFFILFV
jgi:hypothetical protein